jgi:Zn finger protein HypA/HybF involved in hydrogenase expression
MDYQKLGQSHPKLSRGQVWCRTCGSTRKVDSGDCLQRGWPKCCSHTMTIDAPTPPGARATGEEM